MNSIQISRPALPSQVSASLRFAVAVAIASVLALAWIGAEQASHQAVQSASAAISRGAAPAAQPAVEVAGRREAAAAKRI